METTDWSSRQEDIAADVIEDPVRENDSGNEMDELWESTEE
jgi:hypothetical protein